MLDANNYYPGRDGRIDDIEDGKPSSRWVADTVGGDVVKAFNTMQASHILESGRAAGEPGRLAVPVAADDPAARADGLAAGRGAGLRRRRRRALSESWRQEPGTPVYGADLDAAAMRDALASAQRG